MPFDSKSRAQTMFANRFKDIPALCQSSCCSHRSQTFCICAPAVVNLNHDPVDCPSQVDHGGIWIFCSRTFPLHLKPDPSICCIKRILIFHSEAMEHALLDCCLLTGEAHCFCSAQHTWSAKQNPNMQMKRSVCVT